MCPESVCPQGEEAAKIYSQGAVVTNQYGSWTWTGTSWATNGGVIQAAAPPNTAAQVRDSGWLGRLLYSLGNTVSHWFQAATLTSPDDRVNLDRSVATRKEVQDAFVDGASLIVSGIGGVKTATTVAVETAEVAAEVGSQGGLNLFKWGAGQTERSIGWKTGDYMLHLPDKGTPALNWKANYGALRREMELGNPIFETFVYPNGALRPTGGFLNAERVTLQSRGWNYNRSQRAWLPSIK